MKALADAVATWTEADRPNRTVYVAMASASAVALIYGLVWVKRTIAPITTAVPPPALVDYGPNGERFLMVKDESASGRLNVVLNWTEELKRLVPTK